MPLQFFRCVRSFGCQSQQRAWAWVLVIAVSTVSAATSAEPARKYYHVPAGEAIESLRLAARQGEIDILFAPGAAAGVRTRAIMGKFTATQALKRMTKDTPLVIMEDVDSGAFAVLRKTHPTAVASSPSDSPQNGSNMPPGDLREMNAITGSALNLLQGMLDFLTLGRAANLAARQATITTAAPSEDKDKVIELRTFTVSDDKDYGYRKTNAMSATRIGVGIIDTPLNISVVSGELLEDLAVENTVAMFNYTPSVSTNYDSATTLLPAAADGGVKIRGFGTSFVYQDHIRRYTSFHLDGIDRTEVVRGPVGLYFGRSDPGGVINFVSKKPHFENRTQIKLTHGSDSFRKGLIDHQAVLLDDTLAYRVTVSQRNSDDWFDAVTWDETYFLGSVAWRPNQQVELLLQFEKFDQTKTGGTVPNIVASSRYLEAAKMGELLLLENGLYESVSDYGRRIFADTGEDVRNADSFWFPDGHTFNRNGKGAWDNNSHWTGTVSGTIGFTDNLNLRFSAGRTETDSEISWFINQDPHQAPNVMAAFAHNDGNPNVFTALNYGFFISPGFAPDGASFSPGRQADVNNYDFLQADLTYSFELANARHDIVVSFEQINTEFTQHGFLTDRDAFIRAGGIPGGVTGFGDDPGISTESNRILMGKRQQLVDWGLIAAEAPIPGRGGPWSSLFVDVADPGAIIPNMQDFIGGRTVRSRTASNSSDIGYAATYIGKWMDQKLHILAGSRRIDYNIQNAAVDDIGTRSLQDDVENFSQTVFTVGLNFNFTDEIVGYLGASENFVPSRTRNSIWENHDTGATEGGDRVEPQKGKGLEIGLKTSLFDGMITTTVSLFDLKRANIDIQDLARGQRLANENEADGDPGNGPWFNRNSGEPAGSLQVPNFRFAGGAQEVQGGEVEVIYTPNRSFQGIFSASYFWKAEWTAKDPTLINVNRGGLYAGNFGNDGRDAIPDRMENVPTFEFGLWGVYRFDEGKLKGLRVGLGGNYADEQIHEVRTNFNPYVTSSWFRMDVMASYTFTPFKDDNLWRVQLNVSNLLDEEYFTGSFGVAPTREWKLSLNTTF